MKLRSASLLPVAMILAACSSDAPSGGDGSAGAQSGSQAGSPATAGTHAGGGSSTAGAANTSGGAPGTAGAPATSAGAGGAHSGGGGAPAGTAGTGTGAAGAPATGGAGAGSGGAPGGGGGATSVSAHLPEPSGGSTVPQPTGAGTKITVVPWAGFKGAVTYSFDDDNQSQIDNYTALNTAAKAAGAHYTFFLWTGRSQAQDAVWKTALQDGHEIGNHTKSHSDTPSGDGDITDATTFITSTFNKPPYVFAAPSGKTAYVSLVKGLFFINRMVSDGLIGATNDNTDPWNLPTYIAPAGDGSMYNSEIDGAVSGGKWRTICIHGFTMSSNDGAYNAIPLASVTDSIAHAHTAGAWIDTMSTIGAYWLGGKAIAAAMSTTSGTDKTFTWTLPANFPPGRYIRVTTDGGVLKQGGTAIPWDTHGFYEIALDAKSVTLSAQ